MLLPGVCDGIKMVEPCCARMPGKLRVVSHELNPDEFKLSALGQDSVLHAAPLLSVIDVINGWLLCYNESVNCFHHDKLIESEIIHKELK